MARASVSVTPAPSRAAAGWRKWPMLLAGLALLVTIFADASPGAQQPEKEAGVQEAAQRRRPLLAGGGVTGSLYCEIKSKPGLQIFLPDLKVYLHNKAANSNSASVVTDLFGRYLFPIQPSGTYTLKWDTQMGWAAGEHPTPIVIANGWQNPTPTRVSPVERDGILFGRVTFGDGSSPWYYDELFAQKQTATVTVLNAARTATLGGPVHANAVGWYAVAGLPRATPITARVQDEASTLNRALPATVVALGGSGGAQTDLTLPNHKPEILTVVTERGGSTVRTAPTGATIQLKALTRDRDNDVLTYDWKILPGEGTLGATTGSAVEWTLPNSPGSHSVYLQVKDGRGGYARHRVDFDVDRTVTLFSGRAVDKKTGAPVAGADVSVNGKTAKTAANGFFQVSTPFTRRYVFNITKTGYALFSRVVDGGETGQTWRLAPCQSQAVDPKNPIVIVDKRPELDRRKMKGVTVRVPANSLVDSNGNKPAGPVTAHLLTYDLTDGETPGDWGAMRGGKETNLISYGAGFVEFVDAGGTKYNLAGGATAEVEFVPPPGMPAPPAATRMWSYDEADGYWKESGTGALVAGRYVGKVKHFSGFNTDLALDSAACLKVLLYPPLPTGVKLRMTDPTGANFSQTFDFVLDRPLRGIYRVPANINVRLQLFDASNNEIANLVLEEVPGVALPGNIVNSGPPIPPGQTLWPDEPYETCKLVILRLAIEASPSVFLTFKGEGTNAQAIAYYNAVDPNNLRRKLGDWWNANGFTLGANGWPLDSTNGDSAVTRTSYLNDNDLGSGRDMYFRDLGGGKLAAFVTNYGLFNQDVGNAQLASDRAAVISGPNNPGATVCMEFAPVEGQGATSITKFFVYAGADFKANAPIQNGAELDGFGVKFVPNLCLNCHAGNYSPGAGGPTFADIDMRARFRELDTATYKFPGGRLVPDAGERDRFKQQNLRILNAGTECASQPIRDLINGWYVGGGNVQDNNFTPPGWVGAPRSTLYHDVVKHSCRTCHVAFSNDTSPTGINWTTYEQFKLARPTIKGFVLCDNRFMPHAVITYRNFWLSANPHRPGSLRNYSDGAAWPVLGACP